MKFHLEHTYTQLPETFYTPSIPSKVKSPKIVLLNTSLAHELGLHLADLSPDEQAAFFSGNTIPEGALPIAQAYAGHQFGHFNMLGDGRAILLGEHLTPEGQRVDIQLKGAGKTVYSRRGDGRATLRAMLREFLISEAMRGLGVPSSGSLAVVLTGESIFREKVEPSAVLTRTAKSHIRVGTFEYAAHFQTNSDLLQLTEYTIHRHYPELIHEKNQPLALLKTVCQQQIKLIIHWMRIGFIHGVMNTDNMSIAGETIDYGPCAFMNAYDPKTVFSSIDSQGRYAFSQQPKIAHWNLCRLAEALLPIIHTHQEQAISLAEEVLQGFVQEFEAAWLTMMEKKIGVSKKTSVNDEAIGTPVYRLLQWMETNKADYTNTFLSLQKNEEELTGIYATPSFKDWLELWRAWLTHRTTSRQEAIETMAAFNPVYIPRNHRVETALDEVCNKNNFNDFDQLLSAMRSPYAEQEGLKHLQKAPENEEHYVTYCGT
jgi:serine/tyrosine/threonine adenylyltransferase